MKKTLKIAAISGIISLFVPSIIVIFIMTILIYNKGIFHLTFYPIIVFLINLPLFWLLFRGFLHLGKKFNNKLLEYISFYFMIYPILLLIFSLFYVNNINKFIPEYNTILYKLLSEENISSADIQNLMLLIKNIFPIFSLQVIIFILIYYIPNLIFGISLCKLKEKINWSKLTGYLAIISSILSFISLIIFLYQIQIIQKLDINDLQTSINYINMRFIIIYIIGSITAFLSSIAFFAKNIFQIILLFKASEELEEK